MKSRQVSLKSVESNRLSNCLLRMKRTMVVRDRIAMTKAIFFAFPGSLDRKRLPFRERPFLSAISIMPPAKRVVRKPSASEATSASEPAALSSPEVAISSLVLRRSLLCSPLLLPLQFRSVRLLRIVGPPILRNLPARAFLRVGLVLGSCNVKS